MLTTENLELLRKLAGRRLLHEKDGNAYDASGGNFDDAYSIGWDDGEAVMARQVLEWVQANSSTTKKEEGT